jgi:hypothetical protein
MGRSRKNKDKKKTGSYYDDDRDDYSYNGNKKNKKSRFDDRRKDKEIQQRLFVDWDSL